MSASEHPGPSGPPAPAAAGDRGFIRALGLFPATALNMAQMVGMEIKEEFLAVQPEPELTW